MEECSFIDFKGEFGPAGFLPLLGTNSWGAALKVSQH